MALRYVDDFDKFELDDMLSGNMLELLVDTKTKKVYHVHPPMGHAKAAAEHLKIKEGEVCTGNAGHLVPAVVTINNKLIENVIIGRSSLELGCHVKHTSLQLAKAQIIVERLMKKSALKGEVVVPLDIRKKEYVLGRVA